MPMTDVSAFGEPGFDVKRWINDQVASTRPADEPLDRFLAELEMKLQLSAEEVEASLQVRAGLHPLEDSHGRIAPHANQLSVQQASRLTWWCTPPPPTHTQSVDPGPGPAAPHLCRAMRLISGRCLYRPTSAALYACLCFSRGSVTPSCSAADACMCVRVRAAEGGRGEGEALTSSCVWVQVGSGARGWAGKPHASPLLS